MAREALALWMMMQNKEMTKTDEADN